MNSGPGVERRSSDGRWEAPPDACGSLQLTPLAEPCCGGLQPTPSAEPCCGQTGQSGVRTFRRGYLDQRCYVHPNSGVKRTLIARSRVSRAPKQTRARAPRAPHPCCAPLTARPCSGCAAPRRLPGSEGKGNEERRRPSLFPLRRQCTDLRRCGWGSVECCSLSRTMGTVGLAPPVECCSLSRTRPTVADRTRGLSTTVGTQRHTADCIRGLSTVHCIRLYSGLVHCPLYSGPVQDSGDTAEDHDKIRTREAIGIRGLSRTAGTQRTVLGAACVARRI